MTYYVFKLLLLQIKFGMVRLIKCIFALVFTLYGCQEASSQNSVSEIESDGINIVLPETYTYSIDTSSQSKAIKEYESSLDSITYIMRITTYENNMYNSDSMHRASFDLNYSQRYFANNPNYRLIGLLLKSVKGYPGKEFRFVSSNENRINFRQVFIVENNLVELIYAAPLTRLYDTSIDEYFNSFKLPGFEPLEPPFLNFPTESEIVNSPITANFIKTPTVQIEANETDNGNLVMIIKGAQVDPAHYNGLIFQAVLFGRFSDALDENDKQRYLDGYVKTQLGNYPASQLITLTDDDVWTKLTFEYDIKGQRVVDRRWLRFKGETELLIANGVHLKSSEGVKHVRNFLENVSIKKD